MTYRKKFYAVSIIFLFFIGVGITFWNFEFQQDVNFVRAADQKKPL